MDPNRHYLANSPAEECACVVDLVASLGVPQWSMHLDLYVWLRSQMLAPLPLLGQVCMLPLRTRYISKGTVLMLPPLPSSYFARTRSSQFRRHETTDTDDTEFRPAKASRDGLPLEDDSIPDGFYLIGNKLDPQPGWHKAMIEGVKKITHIAPADAQGNIVGLPMAHEGVVNSSSVGKGKGVTNATFASTTEVYPDSKASPVTGDQCNKAQVACIVSGLEYIIANVL